MYVKPAVRHKKSKKIKIKIECFPQGGYSMFLTLSGLFSLCVSDYTKHTCRSVQTGQKQVKKKDSVNTVILF